MIHALFLALVLANQGGPAHAELHPADADVFLEVGDVGALLSSLEKAPMLRFLRDERLKSLFAELGQSPDRPLKELVKEGLAVAMPGVDTGWLDGLGTVSVSMVAVGPATETAPPTSFLAVADLGTPVQAQALHSLLVARAPKHEPMSAGLPGVERLQLGSGPKKDMWCVAVGPRLVVGNSLARVEDYVARCDEKLPALAGREGFKKQLAALGEAGGTTVVWFALARPITEIFATMGEEGGVAFLSQLPSDLNPLGSARVARMQILGERFVTEVITSEPAGASAAPPVDPAWLEPVPSGSMILYASAFDGAAAGKRMRELLAKDEQSAASLAAIEQKLGFGPERLLARLGPGMAVYAAPLAGMSLPETRVWIDCKDAAAFTSDFEALVGALGETLPGFQAKTRPYKVKKGGSEEKIEVPVTTLSLPPGMVEIPMISLSPSFSPVGDKLVFGLNSMDVKNELKRVHGGGGEPIVAGVNPLQKLELEMPAEARSVLVMDWAKLLGGIVGTAKAMGPMLGEQVPFDFSKLPPPEMFAQYFRPTFHYSMGVEGGLYRRNEASFGPETWLPPLLIGAMRASSAMTAAETAADEARARASDVDDSAGEAPPREPLGGGK